MSAERKMMPSGRKKTSERREKVELLKEPLSASSADFCPQPCQKATLARGSLVQK